MKKFINKLIDAIIDNVPHWLIYGLVGALVAIAQVGIIKSSLNGFLVPIFNTPKIEMAHAVSIWFFIHFAFIMFGK